MKQMDADHEPGWLKDALLREPPSQHDKKTSARRDIRRLKWNWLFVCLVVIIRSLNHSCPLPTNHQFIINPTAENLNITGEKIQPGLQQSEAFYSLTYSMFYIGHVIAALIGGFLSNKIPLWYLFMATILLHTFGYVLYALSTTGWMMLIARVLSGISMGMVISLSFSYFGFSIETYAENLKMLGEYDAKKVARVKGYVFSFFNVGTGFGYIVGALFPIILSQFDVDQFRPPGWFCAGIGVLLLVLQLAVFRGECACSRDSERSSSTSVKHIRELIRNGDLKCTKLLCIVIIPLYVILVGGVKGARYVIPDILLSPILSDSFGFSGEYISYFFLAVLGSIVGTIIVFIFQGIGFHGYFLSVVGGLLTMAALLIMTDWQAIPYDSCTEYSLFHSAHLEDQYRMQLLMSDDTAKLKSYQERLIPGTEIPLNYYALYFKSGYKSNSDRLMAHDDISCSLVSQCPVCENTSISSPNCLNLVLNNSCNDHNTTLQRTLLCNAVSGGSSISSCFIIESSPNDDTHVEMQTSTATSLLTQVHIQSLRVVDDRVYEVAVNKCESVDHCHWIPNSRITHQHCSDCQPICRSTQRTLNFVQFTVGLALLMCTMEVMYIGMFLLLSDSVSKSYQGTCAGSLVAAIGTARSSAPLWLDYAYEGAGKHTYLPMLILVALIFPLWLGLLFLYPWLAGKHSRTHKSHVEDRDDDDDEHKELIPASELKPR